MTSYSKVCSFTVHGWGLSGSPLRYRLGLFVEPHGDQLMGLLQAREVIKFSQTVSVCIVLDFEAECQ